MTEEKESPKLCSVCGEPMPEGEEVFKYHGYSGPCPKPPLAGRMVDSASDQRTVNNVMRHQYKVLDEQGKADMLAVKDAGLAFYNLLHRIGGGADDEGLPTRELKLASERIEEAVMWAVKHITA